MLLSFLYQIHMYQSFHHHQTMSTKLNRSTFYVVHILWTNKRATFVSHYPLALIYLPPFYVVHTLYM